MNSRNLLFVVAAAISAATVTGRAQEGHPLAGTWYGDYSTGNQKTEPGESLSFTRVYLGPK